MSGCLAGEIRDLESQRHLKSMLLHEWLVGKDCAGWAVCLDQSLIQYDHAVAEFDDEIQIVGRQNAGARKRTQNPHQCSPGSGVKIAGWLV